MSRKLAKQITEAKVLDAARSLFIEEGWRATHRQIGARAGVSTGSIFASFPDKHALLLAVARMEHDEVRARCEAEVAIDRPVREAVLALFTAKYEFFLSRQPLINAIQHVIWTDEGAAVRRVFQDFPLQAMFLQLLQRGAERGEIAADRLGLRSEMLADVCRGGFPLALDGQLDLETLRSAAAARIDILLDAPGKA